MGRVVTDAIRPFGLYSVGESDVIGNAQMIYAEIIQLNEVALKHKRNCEFWQLMLEAHMDEKPLYFDDMRTYNRAIRRIRKMLKRNQRALKKAKGRATKLKWQYQRMTGQIGQGSANTDEEGHREHTP
jgi:hypothetical protein